jgi:hypothetical protein
LIEYEELVAGDFPPLQESAAAAERRPLSQRKDVESLILEIVAKAGFGFRRVCSLDDLARGCD